MQRGLAVLAEHLAGFACMLCGGSYRVGEGLVDLEGLADADGDGNCDGVWEGLAEGRGTAGGAAGLVLVTTGAVGVGTGAAGKVAATLGPDSCSTAGMPPRSVPVGEAPAVAVDGVRWVLAVDGLSDELLAPITVVIPPAASRTIHSTMSHRGFRLRRGLLLRCLATTGMITVASDTFFSSRIRAKSMRHKCITCVYFEQVNN
jgi:hypothetical protein